MATTKNSGGSSYSKARTAKSMPCKLCGEKVTNVDDKATAVTCHLCVMKICKNPNIK
jgi:hypothetical protein